VTDYFAKVRGRTQLFRFFFWILGHPFQHSLSTPPRGPRPRGIAFPDCFGCLGTMRREKLFAH